MKFDPDLPIQERFSTVWKQIMGERHSRVSPSEMKQALESFVTFPTERKVSAGENKQLMEDITEAYTYAAIKVLERHNAAGEDGLGNDFYCDVPEAMVPRLVEV
ncbi:hypothetical protein JG688_00012387 [Phytophthora aleatoria]|uniref:Uncharacterized protein n=1 Tax=Phytophthora aleatoria TaxID=2496075 RepID=A0A8J5IBB7_9STRA|nr:hypothetical protein JG688_00012387 [Phytophthora aleatoria]